MTLSVLFVCTGNVCRSPTAELLFDAASSPRAHSTSAGLDALDGHSVDSPTAEVLRRLGLTPAGHRARQLSPRMVAEAHLVLTAEVAQRDRVMLDVPTAFQRTFTLKEFVRAATEGVARHGGTRQADQVIALASRYRGTAGPATAGVDDVADAYGGTADDAQHMVDEVAAAVERIVRLLGVARPRPRTGPAGLSAALPLV